MSGAPTRVTLDAATPADPRAQGISAGNSAQQTPAYAYVGNQPLESTDPTGLVDPAALYAEAQDEVLEATGGFEGGEDEFQTMSIPVVYGDAVMSFLGSNGMPYSLIPDGTSGWLYENDSNEELFDAALGSLELGLPMQPVMNLDIFLHSFPISNSLAQTFGQYNAQRPAPTLSARPPATPHVGPGIHSNAPTYSQSYLAQLACEFGHALQPDNARRAGYALVGPFVLGPGALPVTAAVVDGGAFAIRERCVQAVYGPGAF